MVDVTALTIILATSVLIALPGAAAYLNSGDILHPLVIFSGLLILYYPLNAFGVLIAGFSPVFPNARQIDPLLLRKHYLQAVLLMGIGSIAFYAGFGRTQGASMTRYIPPAPQRSISIPAVLFVWLSSVGIYVAQVLMILPRGNALLYHFSNLHIYAFAVIIVVFLSRDRPTQYKFLLGGMFLIEVAIFAPLEFQLNRLLVLGVVSAMAYHYHGPELRLRHAIIGGLGVILLFPISEIIGKLQAGFTVNEALTITGKSVPELIGTFIRRFIGTEALALIIARVPTQVPYQNGYTILFIPASLIPRAIWPSKPTIIMCYYNNIYFAGYDSGGGTCAAMTLAGELFWNFGVPGVVVGFLIFGAIVGVTFSWFVENSQSWVSTILYSAVIVQLIYFEGGAAQIFGTILKELVFVTIFILMVSSSQNTEDSDPDTVTKAYWRNSRVYEVYTGIQDAWRNSHSRWVVNLLIGSYQTE